MPGHSVDSDCLVDNRVLLRGGACLESSLAGDGSRGGTGPRAFDLVVLR